MNSLLLFSEELVDSVRVVLVDERARQVFSAYEFQVGQRVCGALYAGSKFHLMVEVFSERLVEMRIVEVYPSLPLRSLDLVVGLSRPQTTKKVIQTAVMAGVRSLHLVATERGEKSYLDSHILRPADLRVEVGKALEQIWEGKVPEIRVHRSFGYFCKNTLSTITSHDALFKAIALPGAPLMTTAHVKQNARAAIFTVGPEAGWSDSEVAAFCDHGFTPIGLGPRIVRVETALGFVLGQSLLLDV